MFFSNNTQVLMKLKFAMLNGVDGITDLSPLEGMLLTSLNLFGARGITITEKADVADGLREMLSIDGCVVADFHVEPEENVYPMVAVGKGLHEMPVQ